MVRVYWKTRGVWEGRRREPGDVDVIRDARAKFLVSAGFVQISPVPRARALAARPKSRSKPKPKKTRQQPTLDTIRDICAGYSALVVGSGPSLIPLRRDVPLGRHMFRNVGLDVPTPRGTEKTRGHVVVAANDGLLKFPDADFYVTADGKMIYYNHWEVLRASRCYAVLPTYSFNKDNVEKFGISRDRAVFFERRTPSRVPRLLRAANAFKTQSSAMAAVQLAVIIGCSPIYLMGCEGECRDGKKYFWEFPGQPGPGGTKAGFKTIWQQVRASRGKKVREAQYDDAFDGEGTGKDESTIRAWGALARANADVGLVNVTGGLKKSGMPAITADKMLSKGTLDPRRKTGVDFWRGYSDVRRLRGKHIGRAALVMGSAPSLRLLRDRGRLVDWRHKDVGLSLPDTSLFERARNHVTIAINDAILKVPDADFYVTGDPRMTMYHHWRVVVWRSACFVLMPSFGPSRHQYIRGGISPDRLMIYKRRENAVDWILSSDSQYFLGEMNSAQAGVNLAVVLGCSPIYLLGCECRCEDGKKYSWEFDGEPGPGGTLDGYKTVWADTEAKHGRLRDDMQYDAVFDVAKGKTLGLPGIRKWQRLARTNPGLPIIDLADSEWNDGFFPKVGVEEMLSAGDQTWRTSTR